MAPSLSPSRSRWPSRRSEHPRAQQADGVHRVADEHDRRAAVLERPHAVEALELEGDVADGQHLVDEQHLRVDVHGDREARAA